jgi:hypothetical protein
MVTTFQREHDAPTMSPQPTSVWGSRNAALAAIGLNVLVDGLLTVLVAASDFTPAGMDELLVDVSGKLASISGLSVWIGALGFLPWLKATYVRARAVTESPALEEEWHRGPVRGFFIPFVNLVRPYNAVKVLDEALDPDLVPEPAPLRVETGALYRDPAAAFTSPVLRAVKHAPVGLWWALWVGRVVVQIAVKVTGSPTNMKIALQNGVVFGAALAAFVVIWRISERLREVEARSNAAGPKPGA